MYSVSQLQKQQIGLRLPQYLIEEIDSFTKEFSVNRTDIVTEALRTYLAEQRSRLFYERFDHAAKEAKQMIETDTYEGTLGDLIDELEADTHA
jgi:metal-responsive CopG/Arc/MetJ family transcriptional regulator